MSVGAKNMGLSIGLIFNVSGSKEYGFPYKSIRSAAVFIHERISMRGSIPYSFCFFGLTDSAFTCVLDCRWDRSARTPILASFKSILQHRLHSNFVTTSPFFNQSWSFSHPVRNNSYHMQRLIMFLVPSAGVRLAGIPGLSGSLQVILLWIHILTDDAGDDGDKWWWLWWW